MRAEMSDRMRPHAVRPPRADAASRVDDRSIAALTLTAIDDRFRIWWRADAPFNVTSNRFLASPLSENVRRLFLMDGCSAVRTITVRN
jgi:hypothetical protein